MNLKTQLIRQDIRVELVKDIEVILDKHSHCLDENPDLRDLRDDIEDFFYMEKNKLDQLRFEYRDKS